MTATTFASSFDFDNSFVRELPTDPDSSQHSRQVYSAAFSRVLPTTVQAPQLVAHSREVAALVGLSEEDVARPLFADVFGGNALIEGMEPYAANYGGHQFGQWAGQLGDGRAITLAEVINRSGQRWELQLKGAGPTPYSRRADGRAVLRSSLREFLCSEAMHHLGVPTTRALSLVLTGEQVLRDMFYDGNPRFEPGAVVCRVAPSFIRFGNFQLPASRGELPLLNQLIDFTIRRDFPELLSGGEPADPAVRAEWFAQVAERTARMVAGWMRVGFVHGVMNTDNMSILGLTIDYGPYGWVDDFDPNWTPNTTDAAGRRYRFGAQEQIAYWNLARFGEALVPVMPSVDPLHAGMERYVAELSRVSRLNIAAKLGLRTCADADVQLMHDLQGLLYAAEVDMTIFFRRLAEVPAGAASDTLADRQLEALGGAFYNEAKRREHEPAFRAWLERYTNRVHLDGQDSERRVRMNAANPRYVLRNFLAQQAIDRAEQGQFTAVAELLEVLRRPYDDQPGAEAYDERRPDWAKDRAGCSMLSCSS
jgi:uncharacterized protein YdiU (UPF0061 family)